jgi:transcriptional regulator with XRE-family HTH domain
MRSRPSLDSHKRTLLLRVQLGDRLRNRREELRLTLRELASALGTTTQFVGDLERGLKSMADVRSWVTLADALQLNRKTLVQMAWDTRGDMRVQLPPDNTTARRMLISIAVSDGVLPPAARESKR